MTEDRIEIAVQRIETALARIAVYADSAPGKTQAALKALETRHEALRQIVASQADALKRLIGELRE